MLQSNILATTLWELPPTWYMRQKLARTKILQNLWFTPALLLDEALSIFIINNLN